MIQDGAADNPAMSPPANAPKRRESGSSATLLAGLLLIVASSMPAQPATLDVLQTWACAPDDVEEPAERLRVLTALAPALAEATAAQRARWLYCRATALEMDGQVELARAAYTDAIEAHAQLPRAVPDAVEALLGRSYIDYLQTNDPERYCPDREAALSLAREIGESSTLVMALNRAAFCYGGQPENLVQGLALLEEALELARAQALPAGELGMLHNATANLYRRNQLLAPALDSLEQAYRAWAEEDDRQDMFNMLHGLIQANVRLGRWNEAERHLQRMQTLTERSPEFRDFPFFLAYNRATIELARGAYGAAANALERAIDLQASTEERYFVAAAHRMLAVARFRLGEIERAADHARRFLDEFEVLRDEPEVRLAEAIAGFADGRSFEAMQALLDALDAERAETRERMQRNTASQAAIHNRRLAAFESEVLRGRLANRELQLQQAQRAERNARQVTLLAGMTAAALLGLTAFLFWSRRRFRHHAETDFLTGIANRRHAMAQAELVFAQASASNRPLALLLIDIDHFKQTNDRHGHDAGDSAIREVAFRVVGSLPSQAVFGRMGGEEFMVVLPDHRLAEAVVRAERIRQAVAAAPFAVGGVSEHLTISIGLAERAEANGDLDSLYRAADQALYEAKRSGRNRIAVATEVRESAAI